jgi:hypothetical protein
MVMVYYWDGDRNVYVQVHQPDNAVCVGVARHKGTNSIKGFFSDDLSTLRSEFVNELNDKKIASRSERIAMIGDFYEQLTKARRLGGVEEETRIANEMLYDLLECIHRR